MHLITWFDFGFITNISYILLSQLCVIVLVFNPKYIRWINNIDDPSKTSLTSFILIVRFFSFSKKKQSYLTFPLNLIVNYQYQIYFTFRHFLLSSYFSTWFSLTSSSSSNKPKTKEKPSKLGQIDATENIKLNLRESMRREK